MVPTFGDYWPRTKDVLCKPIVDGRPYPNWSRAIALVREEIDIDWYWILEPTATCIHQHQFCYMPDLDEWVRINSGVYKSLLQRGYKREGPLLVKELVLPIERLSVSDKEADKLAVL